MLESDFQTKFSRWAKYNLPPNTACELKITKTSLPFDAVAPHQVRWLTAVKHATAFYKIPDVGTDQKPFDFFSLKGNAFVVVMFYRRGQREFFMIDIDDFTTETTRTERRSLTEQRAREIGKLCLLAPSS